VTSKHALGPLEMQIVGLFEGGAKFSVADVKESLKNAGSDPAYTTVMTVLGRLCDKGVLSRQKDGKRFLYALARGGGARTSGIVEAIHRTLFKTVRARPIAALLEEDDLSADELRALKKLVDAKLKDATAKEK
jgi:BlaI family transcriptional regulator, penicillinase repressor